MRWLLVSVGVGFSLVTAAAQSGAGPAIGVGRGGWLHPRVGELFGSPVQATTGKQEPPAEKPADRPAVADKGQWFGKKVLPRRDPDTIQIGDVVDGKQVYWKPHNLLNCTVREDREGRLRLYDGRREGWVDKADMVTAEDAPAWWDKAVKQNPGDYFAWYMRGQGWKDKQEYDNAIQDLNEALRLKPASAELYTTRGNSWYGKLDYDKAITDYTEAIRLDPKLAMAFNNRALAWGNKNDYDKAIADYTEAIRLDPKFAMAFNNRGNAWERKEDHDKAIADYTEAIRLDPKSVDALNSLTWLYATCSNEKFRDGKKGVELGKRLIELNQAGGHRDTLAAAYAEAGDFELAVAEQRKAIELLKAEKYPGPDDLKQAEARLELYRAKKPYRDGE